MGIVDKVSLEYHLTRSGWVPGTRLFMDRGEDVPRPDNALETWRQEMVQSYYTSPEEWGAPRMTWHDKTVPKSERDTLREQLDSPFHHH